MLAGILTARCGGTTKAADLVVTVMPALLAYTNCAL